MNDLPLRLTQYGISRLGLDYLDAIEAYNRLLVLFKLNNSLSLDKLLQESSDNITILLKDLYVYFNTLDSRDKDQVITDIFGIITPSPSIINQQFWKTYSIDDRSAFDYLLNLQKANDYVKQSAIDKNIKWETMVDGYPLEITINLSKPEKKNSETAKLLTQPQPVSYPSCLLCKQNLGYAGHTTHPSRQNLRVIELNLDQKPWFVQFSPYAYFPYHCIVIDEQHTPMTLSIDSLSKLYAFVDVFPSLFIGSNSDLPIVGGSILNHAHFQAGIYTMPMMKAKIRQSFDFPKYRSQIHHLDWLSTALRIDSDTREDALELLHHLYTNWQNYANPSLSIFNQTPTIHNTITVIVQKVRGQYQTFVILRNNAASDEFPSGIFHAHPEHHPIKQESIGLIEAMGLFILPGRLKDQLKAIEAFVDMTLPIPEELKVHQRLIDQLRMQQPAHPQIFIKNFIDQTCADILRNTGVFKQTNEGNKALEAFIHGLHF
jgi:UDPglucose--hexose-1-phosphate uridylyltransferase